MFLSIGDGQLKEVTEKILGERVKPEKIIDIVISAEKVNKIDLLLFLFLIIIIILSLIGKQKS